MKVKHVLAGALQVAALGLFAETATINGVAWNYSVIDGTEVRLDSIATSLLSSNELTTPSTVGGMTVTTIGSSCFNGRDTLTSITIPYGVTTIDSGAFSGCSSLKTISLPSTLTTITGNLGGSSSTFHPTAITFPSGNSTFAVSGGFLYAKSDKTLHCLLGGIDEATVPSGATTIPDYIGRSSTIKRLVIPEGVTEIGYGAFRYSSVEVVSLPTSLTTIGSLAFYDCDYLAEITIPVGVTTIDSHAFSDCYRLQRVEFLGGSATLGSSSFGGGNSSKDVIFQAQAPANLSASGLISSAATVTYPKAYAAQYATIVDEAKFAGYTPSTTCSVTVKSARMRSGDPSVMDVTYRVTSSASYVKVRAIAFLDGVRDLDHAVKVKTLTSGSGTAIGDSIQANVDKSFAWKISADLTNRLANVTVDVMAVPDNVLPLEFVTIPASGGQAQLKIAHNRLGDSRWTDALLWLYASDASLTYSLTHAGDYEYADYVFALKRGTSEVLRMTYSYWDSGNFLAYPALRSWILSELGYSAATADELTYARGKTGYSLSNGPYAVQK